MDAPTIDQEGRERGPDDLPDGDYAIVEIMGHCTMVGRISEVQRFGTSLCQIEPLFDGRMLEPVFQGGQSIYRLTPCSKAVAWDQHPRREFQLPSAVRARVQPLLLPGMVRDTTDFDDAYADRPTWEDPDGEGEGDGEFDEGEID